MGNTPLRGHNQCPDSICSQEGKTQPNSPPPSALDWKLLQFWRNIDNSEKRQRLQGGSLNCTAGILKSPYICTIVCAANLPSGEKEEGRVEGLMLRWCSEGWGIWVGAAPSSPHSVFPSIQTGIHLLHQKHHLCWAITLEVSPEFS